MLFIFFYYKENCSPKRIVLAVGYGVYSIPNEGTPFTALLVFTSGSKPVNLVITNKFWPVRLIKPFLKILPILPMRYPIEAFANFR